jgi:hypothetical protein
MPPLATYTASGQIRSGPVAPGVDASELDASARALQGLGGQVVNAGQTVGALLEKRQQEKDNRWVGDNESQLNRDLVDWRKENQNREDYGDAFKTYADERLAEYEKNAPTGKAAQSFRRSVLPSIDAGYARTTAEGERTRLNNYDQAEVQNDINMRGSYLAGADLDQDFANDMLFAETVKRNARTMATIGATNPAAAAAMVQRTEIAAVLAAADADPIFAKKILTASKHIEAGTYDQLDRKIEAAAKNMEATSMYRINANIDAAIYNGKQNGTMVAMPSKAVLDLLPESRRDQVMDEVKIANATTSTWSEIKGHNWQEQQRAIAAVDTKDIIGIQTKAELVKLTAESQKQQTEDPVGWQARNDPEFIAATGKILAAPKEAQAGMMTDAIKRMVDLQGPPPADAPEDQRKRYLNLPTGLQKATTLSQATSEASKLNNIPPNQLTAELQKFDQLYPDERVRAMVWNDMQNLPEGKKLKMGLRVGAAINDVGVRNHFLGAMSNKEPLKTERPKSEFDAAISADPMFSKFVSGWKGDGNQRGDELSEFTDAAVRYAMHLSVSDKIANPSKAAAKAVQRLVTDNYGMMNIHGTDVPVHRYPSAGVRYGDEEIKNLQAGITDLLGTISADSISVEPANFPLAPNLPGGTEDSDYIRKTIKSTGTVVVEPGGASATVYLKGTGVNDFAFQLRGRDGKPLLFDFESAILRGKTKASRAKEAFDKATEIQRGSMGIGKPGVNRKQQLDQVMPSLDVGDSKLIIDKGQGF